MGNKLRVTLSFTLLQLHLFFTFSCNSSPQELNQSLKVNNLLVSKKTSIELGLNYQLNLSLEIINESRDSVELQEVISGKTTIVHLKNGDCRLCFDKFLDRAKKRRYDLSNIVFLFNSKDFSDYLFFVRNNAEIGDSYWFSEALFDEYYSLGTPMIFQLSHSGISNITYLNYEHPSLIDPYFNKK